jgi:hypothetical protein
MAARPGAGDVEMRCPTASLYEPIESRSVDGELATAGPLPGRQG